MTTGMAHVLEMSLPRAYTGEEIIQATKDSIDMKFARIAKLKPGDAASEDATGRFHIVENSNLCRIGQISQFHVAHIMVCPDYDEVGFEYQNTYSNLLLIHSVWDEVATVPMTYLPGEESEEITYELVRFHHDLYMMLRSRL
jgi:hypothetical protein